MESIKEYYKIINFRLENPLPKGTYGEKHHIKPKSIYPELAKDPDNLVKLLPEEHYKCHALLPKIYKELENEIGYRKMLFAWNMIASTRKDLSIDEQATEYARLKEAFINAVSEANSGENHPNYGKHGKDNPWYGKHHSEETRKKMSKAHSGENNPNYGKHLSEETREKLSEAMSGENHPMYGKHHSEETKQKMSKANSGENHPNYGKHHSEETRKKISEANSGDNHPRYGKHGKDSPNYGKKYKHSEEYYLKHPEKRPSAKKLTPVYNN